ncbi:Flp pilus assembly protein CpaB [Planctomyces sp. SH-PL14]|uniref:Flp pilus assembly protein CpaB n=1 Tax=Planctomyces sp. SH-PL14 TaxID=1632864 RepID=UPI00078E68AE|nr:Flp pilus assembly protein CpaB [Planctomyces sp. SH-PL14]AMV17134.1 hypothetical protein VT03_04535 [Planctomyces sp. SH-PL14]
MKPKALMLLAVALVCGLVAMMGVQQAMSGAKPGQIETRKVFVAAHDLKPGVPLTKDDVVLKEMSAAAAPRDAISLPEHYEERALKVAVLAGDVINQKKLHEKGQGYGTSNQIPKGMRVMTIQADSSISHSGMLNPGDKVDVYVTFKKTAAKSGAAARTTKMETKVLLEACEVFACESKTQQNGVDAKDAKKESIKNVSLLLTPEQVPYVKLAQAKGTLSLFMRNPLDDEVVNAKRVDESLLEELNDSIGSDAQMFAIDDSSGESMVSTAPSDIVPEGPIEEPKVGADNPQSVQDFVQQNQTADPAAGSGAPAATVAPVPPPVDPNAWTVKIYKGSSVAAVTVTDTKKQEPSLSGWLNQLMRTK